MRRAKGILPFLVLAFLAGCGPKQEAASPGEIFLYGEVHGSGAVMEKELALWQDHYGDGCRHLFIEMPYYTAEFLNCWMKEEDEEILEALYRDWDGTQAHVESTLNFYREIKKTCPGTIFHGTDVGHQWGTTGERYLERLKESGQEDSEAGERTREAMEQGKEFQAKGQDAVYREQCLAANFIREFDALNGESVMGIYGSYHISLSGTADAEGKVLLMAGQLREQYGESLHVEDLSWLASYIGTKTVEVDGRKYESDVFYQDLTGYFEEYTGRYFYRLQDVGGEFDSWTYNGNVLPYGNYPFTVEEGQIFLVELVCTNEAVISGIYRADGTEWRGQPATWEIIAK